jgi:hypothetical protein
LIQKLLDVLIDSLCQGLELLLIALQSNPLVMTNAWIIKAQLKA